VNEKQEVIATQVRLLLNDLHPHELHEVLTAGGVFAPAVSSVDYIRARLAGRNIPEAHWDVALGFLRDKAMAAVRNAIDNENFPGTMEALHDVRKNPKPWKKKK
jgi:hypothetical protein